MAVPAVVYEERGNILQAVLDVVALIAVIYAMYKLFGFFKDFGENLEKKLNEVKNTLGNLNPSDLPGKAKQTGEDIATIIKGTLTGKQNTGEYNKAMTDLHYGGPQWGPGTGFDISKIKQGILKKYGQEIKPGETKVFDGGYYTERVVNNLVKCPYAGGEVLTKEECLARKYGFGTYAQFNAWLAGVKAAARAAGKDPSKMSLDELVKFGRELDKEEEEWKRQNPDKSIPVFDAYNKHGETAVDLAGKKLPLPEASRLMRIVYPKTPGGGIEINYTDVDMAFPKFKPGVPRISHPLPQPAPHLKRYVLSR